LTGKINVLIDQLYSYTKYILTLCRELVRIWEDMPHRECSHLALFFVEETPIPDSCTTVLDAGTPPLTNLVKNPPLTGPHLEEPLLYPQGTEPYDFGENTN
jgi:hypothetical protein